VISHLQFALVAHCEKLKDRIAILDPLREHIRSDTSLPTMIDWRNQFDSKYAALYYPWLRVPDPLALDGLLRTIPPSGHMAGVYARVDQQVGVHKPPANELVEEVKDVSVAINHRIHGDLNDQSINVIRTYNGRGVRVAGARTLSSDIEWRYINVRRLLMMIAEAIGEDTQWTVFEANNPRLWLQVGRVTRSFLDDLWLRGMLDGATAEEAYSVRCDESTNPPHETDQGRLICEVGLNPPWPAEFVVVRLGMTEGGLEILDETRA
jgi:phage tail sheath protein FI